MIKTLLFLLTILSLASGLKADDEIFSYRLSRLHGGMPSNSVREIYQDTLGYMYFNCLYGHCYQYDGYSFYPAPEDDWQPLMEKSQKGFFNPHSDAYGGSVSLKDAVVTYENKKTGHTFSFSITNSQMKLYTDNMKLRVLLDYEGRVWASTNGNGLFVYNPKTGILRHITSGDSDHLIDTNYIVYMTLDQSGDVWVAQENQGAVCLRALTPFSKVLQLAPSQGERSQNTRALHRMNDGTVVFCMGRGYIYHADSTLSNIRPVRQMAANIICSAIDPQGRLWLGTRLQGIYIDGHWYGNGRYDYITADRSGRMWVCGLNSGIAQVTLTANGQWKEINPLKHIKDLRPHTLLIDSKGRMVVGAEKGVLRFNPDDLLDDGSRFEWLTREPVVPVIEDSKQRLWAGTKGNGLLCINSGKHITTADGLSSDVVTCLTEDIKGQICIGTVDGCNFYDPKTQRVLRYFSHLSAMRNFFNENEALTLADGRILLGTHDGLIVLDSDYSLPQPREQQLKITHLAVNGTSYFSMPELYKQTGPISQASRLELSHDDNTISLAFSNFNFDRHSRTIYSYFMEGHDNDWSIGAAENTVTYKDLPPGTYHFYVRSQDRNGEWVNSPQELTISILPPWYLTWWAYLIYILLALGIIYAIVRQIRHVTRLRQRIEVEREVTEYKLKFFTNISHEFRTPLTLIQGSMDRLRQSAGVNSLADGPLSNMQRNIDRMLRLVNQLLEFRRMQNNKLSLSLEETDVVSFLRDLTEPFRDVAEQKKIALLFIPSAKSLTTFIDRSFIDKAVYNLLSNAFKYTPRGGTVTVRIKKDETETAVPTLRIIVEDTGIGVPENMREKIFDRFQRGQIGRDSLGIGLDLTAELIRTHHGIIRCEENTGSGSGSIFTIILPLDNSLYREEDFLKVSTDTQENETEQRKQNFNTKTIELVGTPMNDRAILVVEDEAEIQAYLHQELGRYFKVLTASDGQEALQLLNADSNDIQLVITDVMMPRMNGYELVKALRKDEKLVSIPVVMLTALTADDKQMRGMEVGADAYVTKPFSMQLLLMQCRSLIERRDRYKDAFSHEVRRAKTVTPQIVTDQRDERLLNKLSIYIEAHLSDPNLSADGFAEDIKLGRTTFFNKVKQLTGQTPNEFIRERRLQKACELLLSDSVTVSEVAYQVGLRTPNYFSECFKKRFGITPKQYQKGARPVE